MPISEKQSRELADLKLFHDLIKEDTPQVERSLLPDSDPELIGFCRNPTKFDRVRLKLSAFARIRRTELDLGRLVKNDCIQIQEVQQLLVKYIKLKFSLNPRSEHEQQPLPQDMDLIDKSMKYWEERITELSHNIEFGFENLQALQFELGQILNSFQTAHNTDEDGKQ